MERSHTGGLDISCYYLYLMEMTKRREEREKTNKNREGGDLMVKN